MSNVLLVIFKHAVFALRYWFRLFNMEDKAIQMPPVKERKGNFLSFYPNRKCKGLIQSATKFETPFFC
jgi:hypothetical protein